MSDDADWTSDDEAIPQTQRDGMIQEAPRGSNPWTRSALESYDGEAGQRNAKAFWEEASRNAMRVRAGARHACARLRRERDEAREQRDASIQAVVTFADEHKRMSEALRYLIDHSEPEDVEVRRVARKALGMK